jgi:hypothetical protein
MRILDWISPDENEDAVISLYLKNYLAHFTFEEQSRQRLLHRAKILSIIGGLVGDDLVGGEDCHLHDAHKLGRVVSMRIFCVNIMMTLGFIA